MQLYSDGEKLSLLKKFFNRVITFIILVLVKIILKMIFSMRGEMVTSFKLILLKYDVDS